MKKRILIFAAIIVLVAGSLSFGKNLNVGGFEQTPPDTKNDQLIGAGWGHRSMTFGMMNLMSGMTTQVATIIDSGKASPDMNRRLAEILDHIAEMLNYAPAYMMGTKVVDSGMIHQMQGMLQDLEEMRKEIEIR